jgi:DNA topoisomerase-3
MLRKLIITEKPSVTKDVSSAVGAKFNKSSGTYESDEYVITNSYGHLLSLNSSKMGITNAKGLVLPSDVVFSPNLENITRLELLTSLLNSYDQFDEVIIFTDNDSAGELIFWNIYEYSGSKLPTTRVWTSDVLTKDTVLNLLSNTTDPLVYKPHAESEKVRFFSDLLVGYNLSPIISKLLNTYGLSLGRVQSPLLVEVCNRYLANKNHTYSSTYKVVLDTTYGKLDSNQSFKDKIESLELISNLLVTTKDISKDNSKSAPELYNKTSIIVDAGKSGISADVTSKLLQELYDIDKITSYPRTGSKYLDETPATKTKVFKIIESLGYRYNYNDFVARGKSVFNDKKTQGHYGLIILNPSKAIDYISKNIPNKSTLLRLISKRMLTRMSPSCIYDQVDLVVTGTFLVNGTSTELSFDLQGRKLTKDGWLVHDESSRSTYDKLHQLFDLEVNSIITSNSVSTREVVTKAPPLHTSTTIVGWMEKVGIGTPATIESFYKILISRKYVELVKDKLVPTELGLLVFNLIKDLEIGSTKISKELDDIKSSIIDNHNLNGFLESVPRIHEMVTEYYNNLITITESVEIDTSVLKPKLTCLCGSNDVIDNPVIRKCNTCKRQVSYKLLGKTLTKDQVTKLFSTTGSVKLFNLPKKDDPKKRYNANISFSSDNKFSMSGFEKYVPKTRKSSKK